MGQTNRETEAAPMRGMGSVAQIYKIGRGPSSSHTIGPERACALFAEHHPQAERFRAILYGSLADTGRGHGTDRVIVKTFAPREVEVVTDRERRDLPHPNTMRLEALRDGAVYDSMQVLSVGGGNLVLDKPYLPPSPLCYSEQSFDEIAAVCAEQGLRLSDFVFLREGDGLRTHLAAVWEAMQASVARGIADEGVLPGGLGVHKRARGLYESLRAEPTASGEHLDSRRICAYAFAVGEQNAMGETIVTAPTCGAAGVLPAVLCHYRDKTGCPDSEIYRALATAGLIGDLIKTNASISGAECGCQAEIGSACAMAAAALAELSGLDVGKVEYAAEIAIEHHLGLTCDPIGGLVQIPCIERGAVAAVRAVNAADLAPFLWSTRRISLDHVIRTMRDTGRDLPESYRETARAGLAKLKLNHADSDGGRGGTRQT